MQIRMIDRSRREPVPLILPIKTVGGMDYLVFDHFRIRIAKGAYERVFGDLVRVADSARVRIRSRNDLFLDEGPDSRQDEFLVAVHSMLPEGFRGDFCGGFDCFYDHKTTQSQSDLFSIKAFVRVRPSDVVGISDRRDEDDDGLGYRLEIKSEMGLVLENDL